MTQAAGENGSYIDIYKIDPTKLICSFRPAKKHMPESWYDYLKTHD